MKEEILNNIKNIQSELKFSIYPLIQEYAPNDGINYFSEILKFVNYLKWNEPDVYLENDLEWRSQHIKNFGSTFIKTFNIPIESLIIEDGIIKIDLPIEDMIYRFYEHVISITETDAPNDDLQTILDSLKSIEKGMQTSQGAKHIEVKQLAKDITKEILQPDKTVKKLSKKEQFELDVKYNSTERRLSLAKKLNRRTK